jgi:serine/threonine protein kinase
MRLAPGSWLQGRYQILRVLGSGAAATTYAARDVVLDDEVALKVLDHASDDLVASLFQELQRLRGLWHPALAQAYDLGTERHGQTRRWFLAQRLVAGSPLSRVAREQPWPSWSRALTDTLEALAFLHHVGTRHGDVKPENILVTAEGRGVLIDLGCARSLDQRHDPAPSGTPVFMAPEVLEGAAIDERADLFALGKIGRAHV